MLNVVLLALYCDSFSIVLYTAIIVSKGLILSVAQTSLNFEDMAFKNGARYLNSETNSVSTDDDRMAVHPLPSLVKFSPNNPENVLCIWDPVKI